MGRKAESWKKRIYRDGRDGSDKGNFYNMKWLLKSGVKIYCVLF